MGMLKVDNVTHWSIPVNNLEEAEHFYRDVLGLEYKGRLGNSNMACVAVAKHSILLCQRKEHSCAPQNRITGSTIHLRSALRCSKGPVRSSTRKASASVQPIVYREQGFFPGREMYFLDPSGNMLELRDPTWKPGMPQPTYEEIIRT
jgi:catechol 2,3-dioxygenase-like lactoylglutathione lyase family enzyme